MSDPDPGSSESKRVAIDEFAVASKSESKLARKAALEKFHSRIFEEASIEVLAEAFSLAYPHVVRSLADESEACRAVAIQIVDSFVAKLTLTDYHLEYMVPALVRRVGCPEIVEEAEEMRLLLVQLVHKLIEKCQSSPRTLERFLNDFTAILCKTATDPFPDVRVEAGACIVLLARTLKRTFHQQAESFVKPLLPSLTHQRFRVRVSAVDSLGALVMHGPAKCLELCTTPLAEKLFDEVDAVRMQVVRAVGVWMLEHNDRYSYWHRMIPLLLTGLSDSSEDIRSEARALWRRAGEQFAAENEQDLKKETDFLERGPIHYPTICEDRPHIGCRVLVQRNIGKIVPAILKECEGWQPDARLRSVQLLGRLAVCAEEGGTQHAPLVLACLRRAARDDEQRVVGAAKMTCRAFGYFISPETWWPLLKPELDSWAAVSVLAHTIGGAKPQAIKLEMMKEICRELSSPDRCQTIKIPQQTALLDFTSNVLESYGDCLAVEDELFTIAFTVFAMSDAEVRSRAKSELESLSRKLYGRGDAADMRRRHLRRTLAALTAHPAAWNVASPDFLVFYAVVTTFGGALTCALPAVGALLAQSLGLSQLGPTVRLKLFTALSALLLAKHETFRDADPVELAQFYDVLLREVILPSLVWAPGLTAESVRCAAASCLCCLLQAEPDYEERATESPPHDKQLEVTPGSATLQLLTEQVAPLLVALLDDRNNVTRRRALAAAASAARLMRAAGSFRVEHLHKLYFVVLKRLDDVCEEVRALAVRCLVALFACRPPDYERVTFGAHIDAVYSALLVHLDSPDERARENVLKALLELSELDPGLLLRKVQAKAHLYRNKAAFDTLERSLSDRPAHSTALHVESSG